jgi:hypothetical protein
MSKKFGKARVPECQCEYNYTCGPCLAAAPPLVFTPDNATQIRYYDRARFLSACGIKGAPR